jgi:hypothetical protein
MTLKPPKTAADFLAIAVCPALIMVLVGSLVFFLLQIGYAGEWLGRLQWTLFWFVFAMVLVSRIAIEQSTGAAFLYGAALAGATSLLLVQYLGFIWQVWFLLALIWWSANKITWDCTLIDEDQDASGEGLLQASRIERWLHRPMPQVKAVQEQETQPPSRRTPHSTLRTPGSAQQTQKRKLRTPHSALRTQEVHAPGLWVVYFSLASVPVFGLGELLLGRSDISGRRAGFGMLLAYLAAAFGLLLLTSFLGLRRYLRQRYLQMPSAMALAWISRGAVLAVVVLTLAILLPRPATPYSLAAFVTKLSARPQEASRRSILRSDGASGQSETKALSSRGLESSEINQKGEPAQSSTAKSDQTTPGGTAQVQRQTPPVALPNAPAQLMNRLSYLIAAIVLLVAVVRFWPEIRAALKSLLGSIADLWAGLFGKRTKPKRALAKKGTQIPGQPPELLPNPFQSGAAERMSMPELVRYSFEGLKLWAAARGLIIDESQTPLELAESLAEKVPELNREILLLSGYYSHIAYSDHEPPEDCRVVLKSLWSVIGFAARTRQSIGAMTGTSVR